MLLCLLLACCQFSNYPKFGIPSSFPAVENDLSTDKNYAYRIAMAIINGSLTDDLRLLEVGPVVHSRWLTLACRILRFYVSQNKPTKALILITKFCILVYLPSSFYIKQRSKFTDGAQNFFNILKRVQNFPNRKVQRIATEVLQRNGYFAHQENVLVGRLGCNRKEIREMGVETVLSILSNAANTTEDEVRKFVITQIEFTSSYFL